MTYDNSISAKLVQAWRISVMETHKIRDKAFKAVLSSLSIKMSSYVWNIIQSNLLESKKYSFVATTIGFEVRRKLECYDANYDQDKYPFRSVSYSEDLTVWQCCCNEPISMGLPCRHVLCCIQAIQIPFLDIAFLISPFWFIQQPNERRANSRVTLQDQQAVAISLVSEADVKSKRVREWAELSSNSELVDKITSDPIVFATACKFLHNIVDVPTTHVNRPLMYFKKKNDKTFKII